MRFTIDYFIDKFEKKYNWCTDQLTNDAGEHCALGHCGMSDIYDFTPEAEKLSKILYRINPHFTTRKIVWEMVFFLGCIVVITLIWI